MSTDAARSEDPAGGTATLAALLLLALSGGPPPRPADVLLGVASRLGHRAAVAAAVAAGACVRDAGSTPALAPSAGASHSCRWSCRRPTCARARALTGPPLLVLVAGGLAALLMARGAAAPETVLAGRARALRLHRVARAAPGRAARGRAALPDGRGEPAARRRPLARAGLRRAALRSVHPRAGSRRTTACAGRDGEIYSLHAVGLSLLVLPAYAIGGYPAVSFFMALLAALLVREIRELAPRPGGERCG